jgi:hypothetical protein
MTRSIISRWPKQALEARKICSRRTYSLQSVVNAGQGNVRWADDFIYVFNLAQAIANFAHEVYGFSGRFIHFPVSSNNWGTHDAPLSI